MSRRQPPVSRDTRTPVGWSCARKVRYDTPARAEAVAARIREQKGAQVETYGCRHCGGWHVGRSRPR
jgi:hypothetical protein